MSNLDTILGWLRANMPELSSEQDAGIAGNFQVESGLNPAASNPNEGAVGFAQWEGGRRAGLDSFAASTGGNETDPLTQLGWMRAELYGSESEAYQRLLAAPDAGTAAAVFDQFYERSSGAARATRVANAQAIAAGRPVVDGSGGGGVTAQPAGLLGLPSAGDVAALALKVAGVCVAGALVVVGLNQTVKGTS